MNVQEAKYKYGNDVTKAQTECQLHGQFLQKTDRKVDKGKAWQ